MNIYYRIWADAITHAPEKNESGNGWKLMSLISMSVLMGLNLLTLFLLLHALNHSLLLLFPVHLFDTTGFNTGISVLLTYFLPFLLLNYLLVFYNNRYNDIVKKYGSKNGKLYRNYALISIGLVLVPILLKVLFF